jgi:hypothetical protein
MLLKQSRLAELQQYLERCTERVALLEEEVAKQEKESKETNRTFGEVQSAIENLSALIEHWTEEKESGALNPPGATTIQMSTAQKKAAVHTFTLSLSCVTVFRCCIPFHSFA